MKLTIRHRKALDRLTQQQHSVRWEEETVTVALMTETISMKAQPSTRSAYPHAIVRTIVIRQDPFEEILDLPDRAKSVSGVLSCGAV